MHSRGLLVLIWALASEASTEVFNRAIENVLGGG